MDEILIQRVDVLRCVSDECRVLRDQDIMIRGTRIAAIGPTGAQALTIATRESARVFGLPDDLGHLAPGFLADLILVDLGGPHNQPIHDPAANLVYSVRASDVQTVICDGKVLMRNRRLLTLDKTEIVARVGESMERLAKRVPKSRIQLYRS